MASRISGKKGIAMTTVVTTLEVSCSVKARNKCGAEIRAIISDLRGGDLNTGLSYYLPDEELTLTFLTPWPGAYDPDEDWAMDSDAEQAIRDRPS